MFGSETFVPTWICCRPLSLFLPIACCQKLILTKEKSCSQGTVYTNKLIHLHLSPLGFRPKQINFLPSWTVIWEWFYTAWAHFPKQHVSGSRRRHQSYIGQTQGGGQGSCHRPPGMLMASRRPPCLPQPADSQQHRSVLRSSPRLSPTLSRPASGHYHHFFHWLSATVTKHLATITSLSTSFIRKTNVNFSSSQEICQM